MFTFLNPGVWTGLTRSFSTSLYRLEEKRKRLRNTEKFIQEFGPFKDKVSEEARNARDVNRREL